MVVLGATGAIIVVIGLIATAIVVLPRENRYAIGAQSGESAATAPASTPSTVSTPEPSSTNPSTATPMPAEQDLPDPVLAAVSPRVVPNKAKVAAKIRAIKVKGVGSSYSGSVAEVGSGKVLFAHNATRGYIPASTMKLLTSTAALSILGPDHTFKTSVVSPKRGPYLALRASSGYPKRATINGLARATASQLKHDKIKRVSLGYDSSLFKGPAWNQRWPGFYGDQVSRTSALWVDLLHATGADRGAPTDGQRQRRGRGDFPTSCHRCRQARIDRRGHQGGTR
jgi:D-alanyl-D-alanine carboxypeptidase/D-alanyl-D-alanine-endopeptidase (penicillin-binding protein 4)